MKSLLSILFLTISISAFAKTAYDYDLVDTKGKKIESSQLQGKVTMFVNIATRCGYTGQLGDIEKLYQKYKDKGLMVVGIPSNDFGGQTPESGDDINKFCKLKYGASFPILKKTPVTGKEKHPLVKHLVGETQDIRWNFEKFVVDKKGKLLKRFGSSTEPMSDELVGVIQKNL